MNIVILKSELNADPLGRTYSSMSAEQAATDLNTVYRTTNKVTMSASEVANSIVVTEFNALSDSIQQRVWNILHLGTINPFGIEATLLTNAFGGGSGTIIALAAARKNDVSRAVELGLGLVWPGEVNQARNYHN